MAPTTLHWIDAWYLLPEVILSAGFVLLVVLDLLLPKRANRDIVGWLTLATLAAAAVFVVWLMLDFKDTGAGGGASTLTLLSGSYRVDDFGSLLKLVFLGASFFIVLGSLGSIRDDQVPIKGELYYLVLPATLGAMVMASSLDLITLFVGLELLSITSYVLIGARKRSGLASESAFKYVVQGGVSSAFILYGMSFLYGIGGSTNMNAIVQNLQGAAVDDYRALLYVSFFLLMAGLAMKIALAPFHAWAADVYQGAATPVTSFLAVVAKGAALAMAYRLFVNTALFAQGTDGLLPKDVFLGLAVLAAAAMIVGTAGALRQRNVKRLLALSGVANAGILLVPLALELTAFNASFFSEFFYYLIAYAFMNVGAFAVLTVVSRSGGSGGLRGNERVRTEGAGVVVGAGAAEGVGVAGVAGVADSLRAAGAADSAGPADGAGAAKGSGVAESAGVAEGAGDHGGSEVASKSNEALSGFAGLYHRAPWTAAAMTVLLCSLAGLPVTGGFFGKLFILFATVQSGAYWLATILLATTVVSYAVYFSFIRQMYIRGGTDGAVVRIPFPAGLTIWLCAAATLALGFLPKPILDWIDPLFSITTDFLGR